LEFEAGIGVIHLRPAGNLDRQLEGGGVKDAGLFQQMGNALQRGSVYLAQDLVRVGYLAE
jgi:hypothetical protein